jgi:hypothetical protein
MIPEPAILQMDRSRYSEHCFKQNAYGGEHYQIFQAGDLLVDLVEVSTEEEAEWYSGGHGKVIDNAVNEKGFPVSAQVFSFQEVGFKKG